MGSMGKAGLSTALVLGAALYAAAARPPSRPSTPGSRQSSTPAALQPVATPNATQRVRTPNEVQLTPLPNAYFAGVVPSQPAAVSSFTVPGSTLTITEYGTDNVIRVTSVPPGGRVFLPLEMQEGR